MFTDEYTDTKQYYVFVGLKIDAIHEILLEFFIKTFPQTRYLRFNVKISEIEQVETSLNARFSNNNTQYHQAFPYMIQRYDERYKGLHNSDSVYEWWIPIHQRRYIKKEDPQNE